MRSRISASRSVLACLCLAAAPFVVAGCGGSSASSKTVGSGPVADLGDPVDLVGKAEVNVEMVDNAYVARVVKVSPGTKITFKNTGLNVHNATPNKEGDFEPLSLNPGQSGTIIAPQGAAAYRFFCSLHASSDSGVQRGAILVAAP